MATTNAYTVLTNAERGNGVNVVVHTAVPNANNPRGVNYRTCVQEYFGSPFSSRLPSNRLVAPAATQAQLDAGEFFEWSFDIEFSANSSDAERKAAIDAHIQANAQDEFDSLQRVLRDWGFASQENTA